MSTMGIIIETLGHACYRNTGKHYKNVKTTPHLHLLLYKTAEHFLSCLGRFLECRKCNILFIAQALMLSLIYAHSPLGVMHNDTSGKALLPVL